MKKIILFLILFNALTTNGQVIAQDSLALVDLYWSTNGPSWNNNTNWLTGPVSSWYGISVNIHDSTRVNTINLYSNNLSGELPLSIGNLSYVISLSLNNNKISGNLPYTIGRMQRLVYIYIYI